MDMGINFQVSSIWQRRPSTQQSALLLRQSSCHEHSQPGWAVVPLRAASSQDIRAMICKTCPKMLQQARTFQQKQMAVLLSPLL